MKLKFKIFFRGYIFLCAALLVWSVLSGMAQSAEKPDGKPTEVEATMSTTNEVVELKIPAILEAPKTPQWVEDLTVRFPILKRTLWGNELWKYTFSLIYIFLAFYVSKLLDFLTRVWLKRWAERTKTQFDDLVLGLLNGPIKIVAFVILLRIGLNVFKWPSVVATILSKGFTVVVACSLTYMIVKFVDLFLGYWKLKATADTDKAFHEQLFPVISKSLKLFVIVVASLVTLDNLGVNVTAAIASLSIGGLAIGLAAQDTLANMFGAVSVFVDKPFCIGDAIKIDAAEGAVESIGMRSTRVRNASGHLITIPNKAVGNAVITNIAARRTLRTEMNIGLTYDTPTEKVKRAIAILQEIYGGHPKTADLLVVFNKFADSWLNILVVHQWNGLDAKQQLLGMQEMNLKVKEKFDAEGISFAFPSQTMYLKQDARLLMGEQTKA